MTRGQHAVVVHRIEPALLAQPAIPAVADGDVTDLVDPSNVHMMERIAKIVGLDIETVNAKMRAR